jgi:hypothetical protein
LISNVELILIREKFTLSKEEVILKLIIENDDRLTWGEKKQTNKNELKQEKETFAFDTSTEEK